MTDTSKEMIQLSVEALRKIANDQQIYAPESWDDSDCILRAVDHLDALLSERDALRKAVDSYSYIGRDGKSMLAKDLEDERDALRAQLQAARDEADNFKADFHSALDQLQIARDEALEDAALRCDAISEAALNRCEKSDFSDYHEGRSDAASDCSIEIRALKSTSAEGEG